MATIRTIASQMAVMAVVALGSGLTPASADPGDKVGWSVATDPRQRVFLFYVAVADGPRLLTVACLRDVDSFGIFTSGAFGKVAGEGSGELILANGKARYAVTGQISVHGATADFDGEIDLTAAARTALRERFLPVLRGAGPMTVKAGRGDEVRLAPGGPSPDQIAVFERICLGR